MTAADPGSPLADAQRDAVALIRALLEDDTAAAGVILGHADLRAVAVQLGLLVRMALRTATGSDSGAVELLAATQRWLAEETS